MRVGDVTLHYSSESNHTNVDITVISVDILLDIPFALRGGTREEEVIGVDKDETAATTAAGEASPTLAPTRRCIQTQRERERSRRPEREENSRSISLI